MRSNLFKVSLLAAALSLSACGGDDDNTPPSSVDTPEATQQQTVSGTITDASGNPLADATLMLANQSVTTDASGQYSFDLANTTDKVVVFVKKPGYLSLARELVVIPDQSYSLDMALSPDQVTTAFDNNAGISNLLVSGATVTIPANAVSYPDGTPFLGTVNIAANYYNPDSIEGAQSFAQPFTGQNADGSNETGLVTVGVIDVKLTDPATGNELNLKSGATATLTYPSASTDQDLDTIPLWYYDEDKMIWVKDGSATRQEDGSYRGEVSHFTLWNLDVPINGYKALVEGCVVDATTKAPFTDNFYAKVRGRGFHNSGSADNDGKFSFYVPINTPLRLSSAIDSANFDTITIPALTQNVTYKINDGNCILVSDTPAKEVFNYTEFFEEDFSVISPSPVVITPDPTTPTTPTTQGIIGYDFDVEVRYSNNMIAIEDIDITTTNASTNGISFIEKSLYEKDFYDTSTESLNSLDEGLVLTPQGISDSVDYFLADQNTVIYTLLNMRLENNQLIQSLDNGFKRTINLSDISLAGQKIGDVLARLNNDPDDDYKDIPTTFVNNLNNLPNQLSVFKGDASCKVTASGSTNMDSILIRRKIDFYTSYNPEEAYADSPIKGVWNGIPWGKYPKSDTDDEEYTYIKYNNSLYIGEYLYSNSDDITTAEKDDCTLYNEAAKDQILAAIEAAYPEL